MKTPSKMVIIIYSSLVNRFYSIELPPTTLGDPVHDLRNLGDTKENAVKIQVILKLHYLETC